MSIENTLQHAETLLAAFGGDPAGWEWTGEVAEQDPAAPGATPCACGHTGLKYLFPWKHPAHAREVVTGSVCVDAVPGLSPVSVAAMRAAMERIVAKRRAAIAAAKKAGKEAQVAALRAEVEAAILRRYGSNMEAVKVGYVSSGAFSSAREGYRLMGLVRSACRLKSVAGQMRRLADLAKCLGVVAQGGLSEAA